MWNPDLALCYCARFTLCEVYSCFLLTEIDERNVRGLPAPRCVCVCVRACVCVCARVGWSLVSQRNSSKPVTVHIYTATVRTEILLVNLVIYILQL